nr:MAG: replication associated protein [Cressdnaviricota sp.]
MTTYGICFTYNNYTPESILKCSGAVGQRGISYICWGREVGEEGTPHLQGYIQSKQKQFSRLQQVIGTCHMESQKGTSEQAKEYCKKDGNFSEYGVYVDIPKPKGKGCRNDLEAVKEAIARGESYDDICEAQFDTAAKYGKFIKERVQARDSGKQQEALKRQFETASLRPWQQALLDILTAEACLRKIHWIWESRGNAGKSWMANYLGCLHGATILTAGKKVDMAYIYAQNPSSIVIFDLSRTSEPVEGKSFLDGIYSLAEDLKNGRVVSTKYESKTVFFPTPHVVFLANFAPDMTKWSADRYFIKEI